MRCVRATRSTASTARPARSCGSTCWPGRAGGRAAEATAPIVGRRGEIGTYDRGMGRRTRRATGVLAGTAALLAAQVGPAAAAPLSTLPPYQFTVRAAPVENYLQYFRELVQDVGFSRVQIAHRTHEPS